MKIIYPPGTTNYRIIIMDIRITYTCNNNCLYCLEQTYRRKEPFLNTDLIYDQIQSSRDTNITLYGWNPLLHPNLLEIIWFSKSQWKRSIGILTNTFLLSKSLLSRLQDSWLTSLGYYFHRFDKSIHTTIVNGGISYAQLLCNMKFISTSWLHQKCIIHIHKQNIQSVYRDISILTTQYGIKNFDFVNYFPHDRPYELYHDILGYSYSENRGFIDKLFCTLEKFWVHATFVKFPKEFFGKFQNYYDFDNGILWQVWEEDIFRFWTGDVCYTQKRCSHCFLIDNCEIRNAEI